MAASRTTLPFITLVEMSAVVVVLLRCLKCDELVARV